MNSKSVRMCSGTEYDRCTRKNRITYNASSWLWGLSTAHISIGHWTVTRSHARICCRLGSIGERDEYMLWKQRPAQQRFPCYRLNGSVHIIHITHMNISQQRKIRTDTYNAHAYGRRSVVCTHPRKMQCNTICCIVHITLNSENRASKMHNAALSRCRWHIHDSHALRSQRSVELVDDIRLSNVCTVEWHMFVLCPMRTWISSGIAHLLLCIFDNFRLKCHCESANNDRLLVTQFSFAVPLTPSATMPLLDY